MKVTYFIHKYITIIMWQVYQQVQVDLQNEGAVKLTKMQFIQFCATKFLIQNFGIQIFT